MGEKIEKIEKIEIGGYDITNNIGFDEPNFYDLEKNFRNWGDYYFFIPVPEAKEATIFAVTNNKVFILPLPTGSTINNLESIYDYDKINSISKISSESNRIPILIYNSNEEITLITVCNIVMGGCSFDSYQTSWFESDMIDANIQFRKLKYFRVRSFLDFLLKLKMESEKGEGVLFCSETYYKDRNPFIFLLRDKLSITIF